MQATNPMEATMRETCAFVFILLAVSSAYAQTDIKGGLIASTMPPAPYQYTTGVSAIDQFGNLLVFDTVYSYSAPVPVPVTGQPVTPSVPKTLITVVPGSGQGTPLTRQYPATTF